MDEAGGPGLGGWLWGERGNILTLLTFVGSSLLALLIFYVPYLEGQLRANPAYRHLKARQLAHPRVIGLYHGWLVSTLDRLDRWMGRPGDWRRGLDWCFRAGLVYGYGFMLLAWVLGAPATLGELVLLPDPAELSFGRRLLTVGLIAGGSAFAYLAFRHGEQVEARLHAWLADRLPAGMDEERRRRVAG